MCNSMPNTTGHKLYWRSRDSKVGGLWYEEIVGWRDQNDFGTILPLVVSSCGTKAEPAESRDDYVYRIVEKEHGGASLT